MSPIEFTVAYDSFSRRLPTELTRARLSVGNSHISLKIFSRKNCTHLGYLMHAEQMSVKKTIWKLPDNGRCPFEHLIHTLPILIDRLMHMQPMTFFLIYAPDAYAADAHIRPQAYSADADVHTWCMLCRYGFKPVSPYLQPWLMSNRFIGWRRFDLRHRFTINCENPSNLV